MPPLGVKIRYIRAMLGNLKVKVPLLELERSVITYEQWKSEVDTFEAWYGVPIRESVKWEMARKFVDPDERQRLQYLETARQPIVNKNIRALLARMRKADWHDQARRQILVSTLYWRSAIPQSSGSVAVEAIWSEFLTFISRRGASRISIRYHYCMANYFFLRRYYQSCIRNNFLSEDVRRKSRKSDTIFHVAALTDIDLTQYRTEITNAYGEVPSDEEGSDEEGSESDVGSVGGGVVLSDEDTESGESDSAML